jgi:hypothetical protein
MKLSEIAAKPKLIQVKLDDEDVVKEFGEPLEYWTWDRQPMDMFMRLSTVDPDNQSRIIEIVRDLILDEKGEQIIHDDATIPTWVMMKVMTQVVEGLGKF